MHLEHNPVDADLTPIKHNVAAEASHARSGRGLRAGHHAWLARALPAGHGTSRVERGRGHDRPGIETDKHLGGEQQEDQEDEYAAQRCDETRSPLTGSYPTSGRCTS